MAHVATVLQARMGSRRLPGKVLAPLGPRSVLAHCIARLAVAGPPVIVATTRQPEDLAIVREAKRLGVDVYRGDEIDVLTRFIEVGRAFRLSEIIRATSDNPFVDADAAGRVIAHRRLAQADHVVETDLPVGTAVEVVTLAALERSSELASDASDREHVTAFIRRDRRFVALRATAPEPLRRRDLRLTVDTADDLAFARRIFERLDPSDPVAPLMRIIEAADALGRHPTTAANVLDLGAVHRQGSRSVRATSELLRP